MDRGVGDGQRGLLCCSSWGHKELAQKLHSTSQVTEGAQQALMRGREATRQSETRGAPQGFPEAPPRGEKDAGEAHFPDHSGTRSVLETSVYGGDENREV